MQIGNVGSPIQNKRTSAIHQPHAKQNNLWLCGGVHMVLYTVGRRLTAYLYHPHEGSSFNARRPRYLMTIFAFPTYHFTFASPSAHTPTWIIQWHFALRPSPREVKPFVNLFLVKGIYKYLR